MTEELLRSILKDELKTTIKEELSAALKTELKPAVERLDMMDKRLTKVESSITELTEQFNDLQGQFSKVQNQLNGIQEHLESLDNRLTKLELIIENCIEPNIKLAFEAISADAKRLKYAEDVPDLKSTVSDLYSSQKLAANKIENLRAEIINLSSRVTMLEKAQ